MVNWPQSVRESHEADSDSKACISGTGEMKLSFTVIGKTSLSVICIC